MTDWRAELDRVPWLRLASVVVVVVVGEARQSPCSLSFELLFENFIVNTLSRRN